MNDERGAARVRQGIVGVTLLIFLSILVYNAIFAFSYSYESNWKNVTIDTAVNITNAAPIIQNVFLPASITLTAGTTTTVYCNVSVMDYNGAGDINFTNATLYHSTSTSAAADNNNTHYTNTSCTRGVQNGNYVNFTCGFEVLYHANSGTWTCNASTQDNSTYNDSTTNTTTMNALYALNVSTQLLDYGNLAVGDTSSNLTVNVSNLGNVNINISVKGYGATEGDDLAFVCDVGNISVDNERFSANIADDWAAKTQLLSDSFTKISNMAVSKQTLPGDPPDETSYWQLYVPPNPFGQCNGTITFQAES